VWIDPNGRDNLKCLGNMIETEVERGAVPMTTTRFHNLARAMAIITAGIGATGLAGWVFGLDRLTSVLPGLATMKPNTAIAFLLASTALAIQVSSGAARRNARIARACALGAMAIGVATLAEHVLGADLGIDQLVMRAPATPLDAVTPGRMAPNTALGFMLAGAALGALDARVRGLRAACQALAIVVLVIGFVACTGYLLGVAALYDVPGYSSMAIHTATGFTALASGILLSRPQRGVIAILAQANPAGTAVRRLLPLIVVTLLAVAWLRLKGQQHGFYGTELGLALMVTASIAINISLALWNARVQGASHQQRDEALALRQRAAAERVRAAEQFRIAIEAAPTGMLMIDGAGHIALVNSQLEKIFGYTRQDLLGKPLDLLVPEHFRREHPRRRAAFHKDPSTRIMGEGRDLHGLRKDGSEVPIEIGLNPCQTPDGDFVLASIVDITERKRAMDQLRLTIEAAATGMIMMDQHGAIVLVNAQVEKLFGYPRAQLVGKPVEILLPERLHGPHAPLGGGLLQDPRFRAAGEGRELSGQRRDGSEVAIEVALSPFPSDRGELVLATVVDITERKRAEQALRDSEERLRLAQRIAGIGTFDWNLEDDTATATPEVDAMYGLPSGTLSRTPRLWQSLTHEDDRAAVAHKIAQALDTGTLTEAEWRVIWPDGTVRWLAGRWQVFKDCAGRPIRITGINMDLTERKLAEQEREWLVAQLCTLNAELEERVRARTAQLSTMLEEREVLLQEVHHRVKNNLQVISSLISMQIRRLPGGANRGGLAECKARVEAIALIHEKLYQSSDYTRVPFSDYATSLVGQIFHATGLAPENITFGVDIESIALPVDKAIPCGLILNELISNALKHAFPGDRHGSVRVELRRTSARDVRLAVSDDGVGMTSSADPRRSASLGMQLVVTLVAQLGGLLEVVQRDGMSFQITFPVEAGAVPQLPTSPCR